MKRLRQSLAACVVLAVGLFSASAVFAVEAAATVDLNVRTGPATTFGVIDTLDAGEVVDVGECATNGWCYIFQSGPNGWVSSNYLTTVPAAPGGSPDPDCSLSLTLGSGTPQLTLTCGSGATPPAPAPSPPPVGALACFYNNTNYGGANFCYGVGTLNSLNAAFDDKISSVKLTGGARAKLCRQTNLGGFCKTVNASNPALGPGINDKATSLTVFTGAPPPPPAPVTFSSGLINLQQTFMANLDNGNVGASGADIWYRAVTPVNKFITPRNGAALALGDGSNRGFAGCSTESFSAAPLSVWTVPIGSYVCVRTNQGRISQFRLNGYAGTTMKLGYTTWTN